MHFLSTDTNTVVFPAFSKFPTAVTKCAYLYLVEYIPFSLPGIETLFVSKQLLFPMITFFFETEHVIPKPSGKALKSLGESNLISRDLAYSVIAVAIKWTLPLSAD